MDRPIAHRGLHNRDAGRPENSVEAIEAAMAKGYGIEIDLQLSADGQPMVFHDYDLMRLTGRQGLVSDHPAAELGDIAPLGGRAGIPSLTEVLDLVAGRVPLLIEIKDQDGALGSGGAQIEPQIAAALRGYRGAVALMSFNPHQVARCARLLPKIPRGLVTGPFRATSWPDVPQARREELARIPDFEPVGASFISHRASDLNAAPVTNLKQEGWAILCWTVKSKAKETRARKVADNITFEGYLA